MHCSHPSTSSSMHPASLVDSSLHCPALLQVLEAKVTQPVIEYVVDCVADTVDYAMGRRSPPRSRSRRPELHKFNTFVSNVLTRAEVTTPVVISTLVYIDRAKPHLHIALEEWALERVFLGALIVASKYLNDSTLKNIHWALCTGVFGKRDVGRIEREFLDVLDWELQITEDDLMSHHAGLSEVALPHIYQATATSASSSSFASRPRQHHRSRHLSGSVPELEPCSPLSSSSDSSSSSPQTPSSASSSFVESPKRPHSQSKSSFHDLIRSFPVPIPHRQHQHVAKSQFPIKV
ncbi:hypothetical protein E1B28_009380 [Marasmius oreades]|uniref:Cyclin N-terminal domain-containing protein n=1 Tax=Marasmius oreades TaxID=181124 RepID=A0A9P7UT41_9AGAR|nr:uncharacterized protein E1B28_009380 [Marasmius oreades]KAG7093093.1 hypothetical protein E1B28_009380 [Marasmius oreades]